MTLSQLLADIGKMGSGDRLDPSSREVQDLICHHLKISWSDLHQRKDRQVTHKQEQQVKADLERLMQGFPGAYLTGFRFFYKNEFVVNSDVLIPRPETEVMVSEAVSILADGPATVVDLGAGSGCIGLSVAQECPQCCVFMVEASREALSVAERNQKRLAVKNIETILCKVGEEVFPKGDLKGRVDLVLSNPPYIADGDPRVAEGVHQFEPHQALYAPENGLFWIHKFLLWSYDYLIAGGIVIMEFGLGQEHAVSALATELNFKQVSLIEDLTGRARFVKLTK